MPVHFSRPLVPLGVSGFAKMGGKRGRTRCIHMKDIDGTSFDEQPIAECCICLSDDGVKTHRELYETKCGHCFHHGCMMRLALNKFSEGRPVCCPLCRATVSSIFKTPSEGIPGVFTTSLHVYCHTIGDCWGNHFIYGIEDGRGGRFKIAAMSDTVPYKPSVS